VGATIIDSLILLIPTLLLSAVLPRIIGSVLDFAYLYFMWMRSGATLGNQVTKTKVVNTLGGAIDSRAAVIRGLVIAVPSFLQELFQESELTAASSSKELPPRASDLSLPSSY
jgi:uncharacterized RDD family membrane protein YckC